MLKPLHGTAFRFLWAGQLCSQLGNAVFLILCLWEIQLHQPMLLSLAGLAMTLPAIFSIIGGILADRYSPEILMLATDVMRGLVVLTGLGVILWQPRWENWIMILILSLTSLGGALFRPALMVLMPQLVLGDDLTSANGLINGSNQLSMTVGTALGGIAMATLGTKFILGFDAGTFGLSAGSILLMIRCAHKPNVGRLNPTTDFPLRTHTRTIWSDLQNGWQSLSHVPWLIGIIIPIIMINFALSAAFTMLPFWIHHILHTGVIAYGLVNSSWAAGIVIGSLLSGMVAISHVRRTTGLLTIIMSGFCILFIIANRPWEAAFILLVNAMITGLINAVYLALVQRLIPAHLLGRTMGIIMTLLGMAAPLGALAAGGFFHILPLSWTWILTSLSALPLAYVIFAFMPETAVLPAAANVIKQSDLGI